MKEIFHFYARQHLNRGKTFDEFQRKITVLDLSEFMKFCIEFKIPCKKELLIELFRKTACNTKEMTYDEFLVRILNKIDRD